MTRWRDVPEGATISLSKEDAMSMGGGKLKSLGIGIVVGGILVAGVLGNEDSEAKPNPSPTPSASSSRS